MIILWNHLDLISHDLICCVLFWFCWLLCRVICKENASLVVGFENMLFPVIQEILSNDVTGVWSICDYWHLTFPESLHLSFFKAYMLLFLFLTKQYCPLFSFKTTEGSRDLKHVAPVEKWDLGTRQGLIITDSKVRNYNNNNNLAITLSSREWVHPLYS